MVEPNLKPHNYEPVRQHIQRLRRTEPEPPILYPFPNFREMWSLTIPNCTVCSMPSQQNHTQGTVTSDTLPRAGVSTTARTHTPPPLRQGGALTFNLKCFYVLC